MKSNSQIILYYTLIIVYYIYMWKDLFANPFLEFLTSLTRVQRHLELEKKMDSMDANAGQRSISPVFTRI